VEAKVYLDDQDSIGLVIIVEVGGFILTFKIKHKGYYCDGNIIRYWELRPTLMLKLDCRRDYIFGTCSTV
jgi:hypothetical protein